LYVFDSAKMFSLIFSMNLTICNLFFMLLRPARILLMHSRDEKSSSPFSRIPAFATVF
jgi:hypothetical protein